MKRRQRAGLPIYPQEVQEKAAAFHLQVHHHHHHHKRAHNSSSSLPSLLTSQNPTYNPSLSLFNSYSSTSPPNHPLQNQANSYYTNPNHQFKLFCNNNNTNNNINTGFSLPLSSSPTPYPPSSACLFNQNIQTQAVPLPTFKFDHRNLERDLSFSSMIAGASIDTIDFVPGQEAELPSSQTPPQPRTPSSGSSGGVCVMVGSGNTTNDNNIDYETAPPKTASTISYSGLLDALVQESHFLGRSDMNLNSENNFSAAAAEEAAADKGKGVADYVSSEEGGVESMMKNGGDANADNQWEDLSSSQSSIGQL